MISDRSSTEQAVTILPTCYQQAQHAATMSKVGASPTKLVSLRVAGIDLRVTAPGAKPTDPKKTATAVAVAITPPGRSNQDPPDPERYP
jgi:hypothetical protein